MSEDWLIDPASAKAEALRRIEAAAESDDPEVRAVLDLSDLPALERVPDEIGRLTDLQEVFLGVISRKRVMVSYQSRLSDISALVAQPNVRTLSIYGTRVSDISVLSVLSGLTSLDISRTRVSDIGALSGLSGLTSLEVSYTWVSDVSVLSGLSGLTSLDVSRTRVSDISVLSGLSGLTSLDVSGTPVSDIGVLSGLSGLTSLDVSGTQINDMGVLLSIPTFAAEKADYLSFKNTPAADPANDRRLDLLSRLPPQRCAIETVQYLKGTHPDFRDPPAQGGAGTNLRSVTDRLRDAAEVEVGVRDGKLVAGNASPPKRLAPVERDTRLEALRADVKALLAEAEQVQLPHVQRSRLQRYADALAAEAPTYITLDGPMAILRGALSDRYVTDALDKGFVAGWTHLVATHDELRPFLLPEEVDDLPPLAPDVTPEDAEAVTDDALAAFEDEPTVDDTLRDTLSAAKDYFEAARADLPRRPGHLRRGVKVVGSVLAVILGGAVATVGVASGLATLHSWAVTVEGQAILAKLAPLLDIIVKWFPL